MKIENRKIVDVIESMRLKSFRNKPYQEDMSEFYHYLCGNQNLITMESFYQKFPQFKIKEIEWTKL